MRALLSALIPALFLATSPAALADMTEAERADLREEIRAYLIENPEVIVEAMDILQGRQEAAAAEADRAMVQANLDAITGDPDAWVGGNPAGDLTVVEFMDYRCGYCRRAHPEINDLVTADGNIRYIIREFPILGEGSLLSSRFALAIKALHGEEAYKDAHNALVTLRADATPETLAGLAQALGHDMAEIEAAMGDPAVTAIIRRNHDLAQTLQIDGTPTFIIGGQMVRGYLPGEALREIVAQERAG
jgi:protein-disulfide isomerase